MSNPFRCPKCGLQANNVNGDPFDQKPGAFGLYPAREMTILCHCDGGHAWFESARFNYGGGVVGRVRGMAGEQSPWAEQEP